MSTNIPESKVHGKHPVVRSAVRGPRRDASGTACANHLGRILRCSCKRIAAHRSTVGNRSDGQSLVELALVLPLLLVLLLTISDFGRLFNAGITIESAARTAAETASAEYLREALRVAPGPVTLSGYTSVHQAAWQSVCNEASSLPNATPGSGSGECDGLPTVVCVHDGVDPLCAKAYNAGGGIPAGCPSLEAGTRPTHAQLPESGSNSWPYVEVRVCYRFNALLRALAVRNWRRALARARVDQPADERPVATSDSKEVGARVSNWLPEYADVPLVSVEGHLGRYLVAHWDSTPFHT